MHCAVSQSCPTLSNSMDCSPPGSSVHGDSPGKNTGVGCHALRQVIFPTQESNPGLLHCRQILIIWATSELLLNSHKMKSLKTQVGHSTPRWKLIDNTTQNFPWPFRPLGSGFPHPWPSACPLIHSVPTTSLPSPLPMIKQCMLPSAWPARRVLPSLRATWLLW